MTGLAEGSDMIFLFWPRRLPVVDKTAAISRECGILFGGDDVPGYWRPEYGIWVPFDHTARLRAMLSANIKFGARWLNITTWNDYSENTLVQPSANWGDTRASIVKFYGDVLKQRSIEGSRFFVTSPGEARLGIPFSIEALVLQPDNTSRHVTVWLADGKGNEIARWTGDTPPDRDSVGYAKFTLNSYPEGRFVRAHVEFQRKGDKPLSLIGSPINVWPDVDRGLINRSMFSLSDKSNGTFGQVSLSFVQDKPGEGLIRVNLVPRTSGYGEFEPWAEVQLLYGDIVLKRILRNEGPLELKWPVENFPVDYRFYKFPRSFRCGFVTPRLITTDGTIVYGDPLWIGPPPRANLCQPADIPMTDIRGNAIVDKSLYANHLRISGDVKAVHPTVGPDGKQGLWVSPKAGIQMHPSMLPTGIFTMNLRLMPDSIDTLQKVIDNSEGNNTGGIKFRLSILPGGKLQFIRDNCESTSSEGLVSGRWNNVYIQFDGTTLFFQIEGKAAGAKSFAPSKTYLTPFGREVEQLSGRIDPRFITSIAKSYHGGIADLSISSVISNVNRNDHKP